VKIAAIILSILAGVALVAYLILLNRQTMVTLEQLAASQVESNPITSTPEELPDVIRSADGVIAKCKIVPIRFVDLSFNTSGLIDEVLIQEGDIVNEGQLLAMLSNTEQFDASIASAELEILNAQQVLDQLYQNAPLAAAEALKELADLPVEISSSERQLTGLTSGVVNQTDIDIARANVVFSEKKLKDAQDAYRPYENKSEDNLTRAALLSKLSEAQKEYDATVRRLNQLQGTASETRVAQAEADLALSRVRYEIAQRKYELLKNGPDPDQVALANAKLKNAESQLIAAQAALANMEIRAPFSGTIASTNLRERQFAAAGEPLVKLVDFSEWQVETTNLTELNVVFLEAGNKAIFVFDSLPEAQFPGTLKRIQSLGENRQGDIVYTVVFSLDQFDDRLKWNMTCTADIKFD
jgi:multidrug resistance efflux pump